MFVFRNSFHGCAAGFKVSILTRVFSGWSSSSETCVNETLLVCRLCFHRCPPAAGFDTYRVMQKQPAKPQEVNTMTYAVFNQEGELRCLQLLGASSRDPLKGISNLALKVKDDQQIVGIIVEDECIVYNG